MLKTTTPTLPGYEITEVLDIARGSTVRTRHVGRDLGAVFRSVVGGEITAYTRLLADAREDAIDRMVADAENLGADALVNVRFMTSAVIQGASEILAYGTAVKIKKIL